MNVTDTNQQAFLRESVIPNCLSNESPYRVAIGLNFNEHVSPVTIGRTAAELATRMRGHLRELCIPESPHDVDGIAIFGLDATSAAPQVLLLFEDHPCFESDTSTAYETVLEAYVTALGESLDLTKLVDQVVCPLTKFILVKDYGSDDDEQASVLADFMANVDCLSVCGLDHE